MHCEALRYLADFSAFYFQLHLGVLVFAHLCGLNVDYIIDLID